MTEFNVEFNLTGWISAYDPNSNQVTPAPPDPPPPPPSIVKQTATALTASARLVAFDPDRFAAGPTEIPVAATAVAKTRALAASAVGAGGAPVSAASARAKAVAISATGVDVTPGALVSSVTHEGITFNFAAPGAEIEYSVTGRPIVIGSATITSYVLNDSPTTSPHGSGSTRRHGAMFKPLPDGHPSVQNNAYNYSQGFDGRTNYNTSRDASLSLPITLTENSTFIAGTSWLEGEQGTPGAPTYEASRGPRGLKTAAHISAVSTAYRGLMSSHFAPSSYSTTIGPRPASDLNMALLPNLAAPATAPTVSDIVTKTKRDAVDFCGLWSGRYHQNLRATTNYGTDIALQYSRVLLLLCSNKPTASEKLALAQALCQRGIDYYGSMTNRGVWNGAGGHGPGRLPVLLVTAHLLQDNSMRSAIHARISNLDGDIHRGFDEWMHYYYAPNNNEPYYVDSLFGLGTPSCATGFTNHDCRDPNGKINDPTIGAYPPGAYRLNGTMTASIGQVLALRILGFDKSANAWDVGSSPSKILYPYFSYSDGFWNEMTALEGVSQFWSFWRTRNDNFVRDMYLTHRSSF